MDDERKLASVLANISASEEEMVAYRSRLSRKLLERKKTIPWSLLWVPLAACAILALLLMAPTRTFGPEAFDDFQNWVGQVPDIGELEQNAMQQIQTGSESNQLNAMMVLCLLRSGEDAMSVAAQALKQETRPDFRAFYLEFLLDHADRYRFNPEFVEERAVHIVVIVLPGVHDPGAQPTLGFARPPNRRQLHKIRPSPYDKIDNRVFSSSGPHPVVTSTPCSMDRLLPCLEHQHSPQ